MRAMCMFRDVISRAAMQRIITAHCQQSRNKVAQCHAMPVAGAKHWSRHALPWACALLAVGATAGHVAHAESANAAAAQQRIAHITVQQLQSDPQVQQVLNKEALLAEQYPLLDADHMFHSFLKNGILRDLSCYYHKEDKTFYSVLSLGSEVCGYPKVVHGGLTAAIIDENFGGLMMCLKQEGILPRWKPYYTVQLDVSYKQRMPHEHTIICCSKLTSLQNRKVGFTAEVSDAETGAVYATAKALFVAPRWRKLVDDFAVAAKDYIFGNLGWQRKE